MEEKKDDPAQIANLQATVQQLYATLQDYSTKYAALYEENKALQEMNGKAREDGDKPAEVQVEQVTLVSSAAVAASPSGEGDAEPQGTTPSVGGKILSVLSKGNMFVAADGICDASRVFVLSVKMIRRRRRTSRLCRPWFVNCTSLCTTSPRGQFDAFICLTLSYVPV